MNKEMKIIIQKGEYFILVAYTKTYETKNVLSISVPNISE